VRPSPEAPLLEYDRIAENRRWTWMILVVFAVLLLPAAVYLNELFTAYFAFGTMFAGTLTEGGELDPQATIARGRLVGLAIALGVVALVAWIKFRLAGRSVIRMVNARPVLTTERASYGRAVENLCIGSGLPEPDLYVIDSRAANACSAGLKPDAASIAVTTGLLELLEYRELEAVLAQELAQIGNLDTRLKTTVAAIVTTLWLPLRIVGTVFRPLFRIHRLIGWMVVVWLATPLVLGYAFALSLGLEMLREDPAFAVVFIGALLLPVYAFVGAPLGGSVIRAALSQEREFLADAEAVLLTRNPAALARALIKMSAAGTRPAGIRDSVSHLFILDPALRSRRLGPTHPRLEDRVSALMRMDSSISLEMVEQARAAGGAFGKNSGAWPAS